MMNRLWVFHCGVDPGFHDLKNKETILVYHLCVNNPALEICIAFINEWRADFYGRFWRKTEFFEFVYFSHLTYCRTLRPF